MILLDTNVFLIDRFFTRDERLGLPAVDWFSRFRQSLFGHFRKAMSFGDALVLQAAEDYAVDAIITWNKKHFEGRTTILVLTPEEYLAQQTTGDADDE